jgi:excisionase family DNA binding protein
MNIDPYFGNVKRKTNHCVIFYFLIPFKPMTGFLTTAQAAEKLGITAPRVRQMILDGRISAEKVGSILLIPASEIERISKLPRKPGRPAKPAKK